jgi:hypothetical protein
MTPVPGDAGLRKTRPEPKTPSDSCVIVEPVLGHAEEVLLGLLDALLDRERDLVGLAVAHAHHVALVAHHDQRGEGEAPAALDDLRDAVDLHDPLLQVEARGAHGAVDAGPHTVSPPSRTPSANAFTRPWYW